MKPDSLPQIPKIIAPGPETPAPLRTKRVQEQVKQLQSSITARREAIEKKTKRAP